MLQVQQRCLDLLEGREDFGAVCDVFERLTGEFLQHTESFGEKIRNKTGMVPTSSDSSLPNMVNRIVKMEDQQATVKVEVKSEGGVGDAMKECFNDPPSLGTFKSDVKEENEYKEGFQGIFLQARAAPEGTPIRRGIWKPSQQLAELLGISKEMKVAKAAVLRMLWVRLEKLDLLDPNDNRFFTPDKAMAGIFGAMRMRATHMGKCVKDHLMQDKED